MPEDGMGAKYFERPDGSRGAGFRVWAPFARGVFVSGEFCGWAKRQCPLRHEGNGYWYGEVPNLQVGDHYKYVLFGPHLDPNGAWRIDPYARELSDDRDAKGNAVAQNAIVHPRDFAWSGPAFQQPGRNEMVLYELHVGTFHDLDVTPAPGRFAGVIERLDHLEGLGINMIEVMAVGEFNADHSWGYNPAYPFAIEEAYGGINGFKWFVEQAHAHRLGVVMDVVYNHLGPPALDMYRFDGWHENGRGGIYFYNDFRAWTDWGDDSRPDYGRPEVRTYLKDNAEIWQDKRHVDGLRYDATAWMRGVNGNDNPPSGAMGDGWSLLRWLNDEKNRRYPWKISIAEDLKGDPSLTRPTDQGGAGFDAQWDAGFRDAVRAALAAPSDEARDLDAVRRALEFRYNGDPFQRVIYLESHDDVTPKKENGYRRRVTDTIWQGNADSWHARKRALLGAGLLFTAPGIPMLFQGQEWGEWEGIETAKGEQIALDWGHAAHNGPLIEAFRWAIQLRRNWHDNTRGLRGPHVNVFHVNPVDKVMAYHRWDRGGARDDVVVVANFSARSYGAYRIGMPRAGRWRVRYNSDAAAYGPDFGNTPGYDTDAFPPGAHSLPFAADVGLGPYALLILSQDD
jgi:1,4-alpha-glucan branching enzyme